MVTAIQFAFLSYPVQRSDQVATINYQLRILIFDHCCNNSNH